MQAIFVDISGPEPPPAYVATLLRACTSALRAGKCARGAPDTTLEPDELLIHVVVNDELRFELVVDASAERPALSRALVFRSADAIEERWRSVGISIASMASEGQPTPEPPPPPPTPTSAAAAPAVQPAARSAHEPHADSWRLGAGLQTGSGASSAPPRLGGFVTLARVLPFEAAFGLLSARYALGRASSSLIDLEWTTLGAGLGASLLREPVALRVQASAIAQRVAATATDRSSGESSSASRWLGGGLVGLDVGWPGRGPLGAVFGVEAGRLSGGTAVRLNRQAVAQSPALQWGFQVGLEYRR